MKKKTGDQAAELLVLETIKDFLDGTTPTPTAYRREEGVVQIKEFDITAAANAGLTTIATIMDQACLIESIVLHSNSDTTVDFDDGAIEGGTGSVQEFISASDAIYGDLNAEDKQVGWDGPVKLSATKTITIDLQGSGSTPVDFTVTIKYRALADGGYLA